MSKALFQSATLRMTLWYLLILMLLSLVFSAALYRVMTREYDRDLDALENLQESPLFVPRGFNQFRDQRVAQINESKQRIQINLLYFNLIILGLGGAASYFLAQRTLEPIEAALEAQNRFTADASHELRTPLTAMKTELEVALRDKKLTLPESKKLHESNLEEVARLEQLANGLLVLAQSQQVPSAFESLSMVDIISTATSSVEPLAQAKQMNIEVTETQGVVSGDQRKLTELVTILLENAIKYSDEKTTVAVSSKADPKTKKVTLTVDDEGCGISREDLPHIFDRFYRADISRSQQNVSGYGLGLAIAKKIVEAHHGTIDVTSQVGKGSIFTVVLPLTI